MNEVLAVASSLAQLRSLVQAAVRHGWLSRHHASQLVRAYWGRRDKSVEPGEFLVSGGHLQPPQLAQLLGESVEEPSLASPIAAPQAHTGSRLRTRRLRAEAEELSASLRQAKAIRIERTEGSPPERYTILYKVKGLAKSGAGKLVMCNSHRAELYLPLDYPKVAPQCRMLTPAYHPNIDANKICIADHWAAGERLLDLIVRIGQMLAYQDYNIRSPLDAEAARWADMNRHRLPIDPIDLYRGIQD